MSEFKDTIHEDIRKFIPIKLVGTKKHLPGITSHVKRYKLYQKFKRKSSESRKKFLKVKHAVKYKIKCSYENYLKGIQGLINPEDDIQDSSKSGISRKKKNFSVCLKTPNETLKDFVPSEMVSLLPLPILIRPKLSIDSLIPSSHPGLPWA